MHFSKGQIIFALSFFVVFVVVMIWAYRKDKLVTRQHYRGAIYILLGIIAFLLIYRVLVKILH